MDDIQAVSELVRDMAGELDPRDPRSPLDLWRRLVGADLHEVGLSEEEGGAGGDLVHLCAVVRECAAAGINVPVVEYHLGRVLGARPSSSSDDVLALHVAEMATLPGEVTARLAWGECAQRVAVFDGRHRAWLLDSGSIDLQVGTGVGLSNNHSARLAMRVTSAAELRTDLGQIFWQRSALLRAAGLLGAASTAFRMTDEYVTSRHQFGRPLRKLPAVARSLAVMRVQLDKAEAALSAASQVAHLLGPSSMSRVVAADCADEIVRTAHQLHGAMGTTWEHPLRTVTTMVWDWRDAERPVREWKRLVGEQAAHGGEPALWKAHLGTANHLAPGTVS